MSTKINKKRHNEKNARKVFLLKYKDKRETLILSKVKSSKESLKIEIQCKKRVNRNSHNVNEVNRTRIIQNERYPIFRAQLKDRIVPRCLRDKCRTDVQCKTKQCRSLKDRRNNNKKKARSPSLVTISDEECDGLQYDEISSGTLSTYYAGTEIDVLMESTRKRMKDSDEEWKMLPKNNQINIRQGTRSPSLNSLDTLILDAMEEEEFAKETNFVNLKSRLKYEPHTNVKRKRYFDRNKDDSSKQNITATNSKITKTYKEIKSEPLDHNNSKAKHQGSKKSNQSRNNNPIYHNKIKLEASEITNESINQAYYKDPENIFNYYKKDNKIDAVITKLEKNDSDTSALNLNLLDIKQELYHGI